MRHRLRAWLEETQGARLELARHFAARLFDSEMFAERGGWVRPAIGVVSGLVPLALLVFTIFWHRYGCVNAGRPSPLCPAVADYRAQYLALVRDDVGGIVALAMCLTAVATAAVWQALFPSRRDLLALASLPVSAREIFAAKFAAASAAFAVFAAATNAAPSLLFAGLIQGPWQANPSYAAHAGATFLAACAAAAFVFFGLLAIQGMLLGILPPAVFGRVTLYAQAAVFTAGVGALPFLWVGAEVAERRPVVWFADLWRAAAGAPEASARPALIAAGLAATLAVAGYLCSYGRCARWLLEPPARAARRGFRPRLPERWMGDPREQAMLAFIAKTLARSRTHRLVLLLYSGLALAWMAKGVGVDAGSFEFAAVFVPLTAAVFSLLALRYLFSLPVELAANWLFRINEAAGRGAWLRALERFAVWCALVPIHLCGLPVALAAFGPLRAAGVTALSFAVALLVFELLFRGWRKAPFACSYDPGRRPLWFLLLAALAALLYVATVSGLVLALSGNAVLFAGSWPLLVALRNRARRKRQAGSELPLVFDDLPEPALRSLNIEYEGSAQPAEPAATPRAAGFWNVFRTPAEAPERALAPWFAVRDLPHDFRYALRAIRRNAALSSAVAAILALGIGMNVSVFTLIDGCLLRARVPDPGSFVRISPVRGGSGAVTDAEYRAYREEARTVAALAAWRAWEVTVGEDHSSAARVLLASCSFFPVYGLHRALSGRLFQPGDCEPAGQAVVVLSEEAWRRRFGADPALVGKTVALNDRAFTVVGIAPARCAARINGAEAWLPHAAISLIEPGFDLSHGWLTLEGRLARGASRAAAQGELRVITSRLDRLEPDRRTVLTVGDGSWIAMAGAGVNRKLALWMLAALSGGLAMVLLIACVNAATLLLSRAVSRRREMAVRLALGAPRARLLRMLFIESFLLTGAAGCTGLYIAWMAPEPLYRFLAGQAPDFSLAPDARAVFTTLAMVAGAACLSGLIPALESLRVDLAAGLKGETGAAGGSRFRQVLVCSQTAMSLALLVAAALGGRAFLDARLAGSGLETSRVLAVPLRLPLADREAARATARRFADRIRQLPGVRSVAHANELPAAGGRRDYAVVPASGTHVPLGIHSVSAGYFETLGIPILRGREFREGDLPAGRPAVVSESLARAMWGEREPVGRRLATKAGAALEVVGVARDVGSPGGSLAAYVLEEPRAGASYLLVRCLYDPESAAGAIRAAIRELNPAFVVTARPLQAFLEEDASPSLRLGAVVWTVGTVAFLLAIAGIYGIVSFEVSRRTKEIGIRMALGARRPDILREILVSHGRLVMGGLFAGLWLSLGAGAVLRHAAAGAPADMDSVGAAIHLGTALLLALAAAAAICVSALRGTRIDPAAAVRGDR